MAYDLSSYFRPRFKFSIELSILEAASFVLHSQQLLKPSSLFLQSHSISLQLSLVAAYCFNFLSFDAYKVTTFIRAYFLYHFEPSYDNCAPSINLHQHSIHAFFRNIMILTQFPNDGYPQEGLTLT